MVLTLGGIAAIALVVAAALMIQGIGKKVVVYLMLVAGLGLTGIMGALLERVMTSAVQGTATVSQKLLGAGAVGSLILFAWMATLLIPRLKPKGTPPTKWTKWIALTIVPVMVATGGVVSSLAGLQENLVTEAASVFMTAATALVQGF